MRLTARLSALSLVLTLLPALPASAEPYDADPLGLVPFMDTTMQQYSLGEDVWEVWHCTVPGEATTVDLAATVANLNTTITPYFQWLSGSRYMPRFVSGGTVSGAVATNALSQPEGQFATECTDKVSSASKGGVNGALVVVDIPYDAGYSLSPGICPEPPFSGCTTGFPANRRITVTAAAGVRTVAPFSSPQWITVAHEIGHSHLMPHSYSGLTNDPQTGLTSQYDDPMDVMSGAAITGNPIGTHAYNRYAAGWIDPANVVIHSSGIAIYDLAAIGSTGTAMVALPSIDPGRFYVLDARRRSSYDGALLKAGVEIHEVDQRREIACALPSGLPDTWPCFATLVRITPTPPRAGTTSVDHVLSIDESATVGRFVVTVTGAPAGGFSIRVTEGTSGTFVDDDGLLAEPDIETIAAAGITKGCDAVRGLFCPGAGVTRAEMAAFIVRALEGETGLTAYQGLFLDVPETAWYAPYVERLAALGITQGTGPEVFAPTRVVSRAEMAAFLVRAFGTDQFSPVGIFGDVPPNAWYIEEVEELYAMGLTKGCSANPLLYCPTATVTRAQMAQFLARALSLP